ncbi:MAG: PAC2 family protein [Thermoplasmata archaeon]|nr:PAC2 family protein [Thermoplasmata archaeon]MCI4344176.1 PAC2 family protein [Thermoplasmata archaeon]
MGYTWRDEPGVQGLADEAVVLVSFPSAGLAATVAAHFIVQSLKLPRIGTFESPDLPPLAVIQGGQVQPPIRVYGRSEFALVVSEFPVPPDQATPIAETLLAGAATRHASMVLSLEGVVPHPTPEPEDSADESMWAITSRPEDGLVGRLQKAGARTLADGVIGGVSGALLIAGIRAQVPTATLLVSARTTEGYPDHRAGAALIETLDRLLPVLKLDTGPLRSQAEMIERALRAAMKPRSKPAPEATASGEMTIYQ